MKEKQFCLKREFQIVTTPEEVVRQQLLNEILAVVPKDFVEIEIPIKKYGRSNSKLRADLIILNPKMQPFLLIECKEPREQLTLNVKEQAMGYNTVVKAPFIAVTNGRNTQIFKLVEDEYKQISLVSVVDFILGQPFTYIEKKRIKRLALKEAQSTSAVQKLIYSGNISPGSAPYLQRFLGELYNAILVSPFHKTHHPFIEDIVDLGYGFYGFGNGSGMGGRFNSNYRSFLVTIGGNQYIYRMTLAAPSATSNDPVYGNRKGSSSLYVGIQKRAQNAHVLEMKLDGFHEVNGSYIRIHHDGWGLKKHGIIEVMTENFPEMMEDKQIILGELPYKRSIEPDEFSRFVENVICYCHVRSYLKQQKKETSKKA